MTTLTMSRQHLASIALVLAACTSTADPGKTAPNGGPEPQPSQSAEPAPAPAPKLSVAEQIEKHGMARMAAWESKDVAKIDALYAPGAVVAMANEKGWVEMKPSDMDEFHKAYWGAFPDAKNSAIRILAKDGVMLVEWAVAGTNTGPFMGAKETGKKVGYRGASIAWLNDEGKVTREHVYVDQTTLMGQLGMLPKGSPFRAAEAAPSAAPEIVIAQDGDDAKHKALFDNMLDLSGKKDVKGLVELMNDDVVFTPLYMPADDKGKKAIEKSMNQGNKTFADDKFEIRGCIGAGDYIACETTWTATWKGPLMGMKPNGKTGTMHGLDILKVKDGKIQQWTGYGSGLEFAAQFGIGGDQPKGGDKPKGG